MVTVRGGGGERRCWKGEEGKVAGSVGERMAREACSGFPLVVNKAKTTNCNREVGH